MTTDQRRIGVLGGGPLFDALIGPCGASLAACWPKARLLAMVPPGIAPGLDLPAYGSWRDMLAAHPDLNLVLDLTGDEDLAGELRRELPAGVSLLDRRGAELLLEALAGGRPDALAEEPALRLVWSILDRVHEDVLLLDLTGRVIAVNKFALDNLERPREEILGRRCWEVFKDGREESCRTDGEDCPVRLAMTARRNAEGTRTRVDEHGRLLYFQIRAYPLLDDQGGLERIVVVRRDVTRRTYMEKRLQQSEKLAAIGELSTFIAHEIRNPLFAIGGFANALLRSESLDKAAREKAGIILEESRRLDKILKSILNFARPTHAKPGESDVNQVVRETMDLMGLGCSKQGVEAVLDLAQGLAMAKLDAEMLKQCLINLVKNGLEAMPDGGRLTVRTAMTSHHVVLEVEDSGQGFPPEIMDRVFNPFFSTKDKGSGLGLAMIRKILDEIGGDIRIRSAPGQGATVTLLLPPVVAYDAGSDAGTPPASAGQGPTPA